MNKILSIIGVALIGVSAVVGYFFNFSGDSIIAIATGFFGAGTLLMSALKDKKVNGEWDKSAIAIGTIAGVGGLICAIGGVSESVITGIVGAVLAVVAVIIGVIADKTNK